MYVDMLLSKLGGLLGFIVCALNMILLQRSKKLKERSDIEYEISE